MFVYVPTGRSLVTASKHKSLALLNANIVSASSPPTCCIPVPVVYVFAASTLKKLPPYLRSLVHAAITSLVSLAHFAWSYVNVGYWTFKKPIVSSTM